MKALIDCHKQSMAEHGQSQSQVDLPLAENPDGLLQQQDQSPPIAPPAPKLTILPTVVAQQTDDTSSSASSSPTSPTSSYDGLASDGNISFSFSSPIFYDEKLYIYHTFLDLFQRLGQFIKQRPFMLLVLQYSIASIHGVTVYLVSVILSVAQLIMIAATVENLEWVQTYKPLMNEWDSCLPGFVFPALDIESESEDDSLDASNPSTPKDKVYWASKMTLKSGDDHVDDGYHSEENIKRMEATQSMDSTIRRRLVKYQGLSPSFALEEEYAVDEPEGITNNDHTGDEYTGRFKRALAKTLSGALKPSKSKRVTFNEQVQVMGRKRRSSSKNAPSMSSTPRGAGSELAASDAEQEESVANDNATVLTAEPFITKYDPASPLPSPVSGDADALTNLAQEEAEYQRRMASKDVNGSRSSSPVIEAEPRMSTDASLSSPTHPKETSPSGSAPSSPVFPDVAQDTHDIRRAVSIPLKLHSLLHRHRHGQKSSVRHSATFSEPSTPTSLPSQSSQMNLPEENDSQQGQEDVSLSPTLPLSLGTRAKRSLSLVIPRHGHGSDNVSTEAHDDSKADKDHHGSVGRKNKLMYRIVHPQRYKRELEQQLSDKDRQRLLTMVHLQHKHLLESGDEETSEQLSHTLAPISSQDQALCGNAYYYATSAEYVEGLGAPDSVISTSVGTSFPEELQSKKTKSKSKVPRPLNLAPPHNAGRGNGTEGEKSIFKWHPHSPIRLQHLFHPGHKHTQSTSSLIHPPGSVPTASAPATITTPPTPTTAAAMNDSIGAPPVAVPPIATGPHRAFALGRTDSEDFTSFASLGMPMKQTAHPIPLASSNLAPEGTFVSSHDPDMEHTTFASLKYRSPNPSPAHSAPSSPRQSVSLGALDQDDEGHHYPNEYQQEDGFVEEDHHSLNTPMDLQMAEPYDVMNGGSTDATMISGKPPHKGLNFIRKLSKKMKK
ncbi:hypothetical protein BGX34_011361 [Mortierella sp. NVP85]|nr:hypothetical protein BGX34_011361 [Mortierella sp. NVP85]